MKLKILFLIPIIALGFVAIVLAKKYLGKKTEKSALVTIAASSESMGDSISPSTMDYFQNVQYPQMALLVDYLKKNQVEFEIVNWQDGSIDWSTKSRVIIGPVWGYSKYPTTFLAWINKLNKNRVKLVNNHKFITWNANKKYLINLQDSGINIPSSMVFDQNSPLSFKESYSLFQDKFSCSDVIIKGLVDAAGFSYYHVRQDNLQEAQEQFNLLKHNNCGVIIQKFIPEIYEKGEFSFVFFNGQLSHYFLKIPKTGEERVQSFYGGKSFHFDNTALASQISNIQQTFRNDLKMTPKEIENAPQKAKGVYSQLRNYLATQRIPEPAFVRLDAALVGSELVVMEVEGIEPYLEIKAAINAGKNEEVIISNYAKCLLQN